MNRSLGMLLVSLLLLLASWGDARLMAHYDGLFGDDRDLIHVVLLFIGSLAILICLGVDGIKRAFRSVFQGSTGRE